MKNLIIITVLIYFLAMGLLFIFQIDLIYKKKYAHPYKPIHAKLLEFTTSDGIKLEGGLIEHNKKNELVLYFGGNAANVLHFLDNVAEKIDKYNFIAFNYPGYGNSKGKPSQEKILKYALEIAKQYKPKHIIGRSLGTSVASFVSSKYPVESLLLITPFDSIEEVAQNLYPIFPIKLLIKDSFRELEWLKSSKAKCINAIFVKNDEVIPKENIIHLQNEIEFNKSITIDESHNYIYLYHNIDKLISKLLECKE